ncbi:hypothetical protein [Clostridium gasigenes]|uniref:Uncharacterized protein n=1 Tax=Clostridium gasigenes TaxID=94869 RepID=A0A1H0QI94_9CLOT|nr:hypothetical protein [Clostridium gasigenes]MBB6624506.1 hypothetical protein [Clostridium gasigenes]SDP16446.1 hypothetical protein SAMN04488529_102355 [Clostridium gasigenes]
MNLEISSYVGAGYLKLGKTRNYIRKCFDNKFKEFKKTPISETSTDDFGYCHVYYTKEDKCEAIEFFEIAKITFNGKSLMGEPYNNIKKFFEVIDNTIDFDDNGFTSIKYGIGVYAPFAEDEPKEPVESIIIFEKGYYD